MNTGRTTGADRKDTGVAHLVHFSTYTANPIRFLKDKISTKVKIER